MITRRRYLKLSSMTGAAGCLGAPAILRADPDDAGSLLEAADERIEKHRKSDATLRVTLPDGRPVPSGTRVRIEQVRHRFLFGCNLFKLGRCKTPAQNETYLERFAGLLNFATLPFYWWSYEGRRGKPDYKRTEDALAWCREEGVTPKGHPLAWNWIDPRWARGMKPAEVMKRQFERIEDCVGRFKGQLDIWDVVNEATDYGRKEPRERAPALTAGIEELGVPAYLAEAFRRARKANPDATLLINDYRMDPAYADKVIRKLVDENGKAMYDVIGLQSHMHGGAWPDRKVWETCERFAPFGVPLHLTETTVVSGARSGERWQGSSAEGERKQAEAVARLYKHLFSHPSVEAITWWDFSDQGAWMGAPSGLIRTDMTPKPAYERLRDLVKKDWWTQTEGTAAKKGGVTCRGFHGDYRATATVGSAKLRGSFSIAPGAAGKLAVPLREV